MTVNNEISQEFGRVARAVWIWSVVRGVIAVIFGIVALVSPLATAVALAIVIGIFAVVDGLVDLIDAFRYRGSPGVPIRIALGVTSLVFGILILVWPRGSLTVLAVLVAIWAILIGVLQVAANLGIRRESGGSWVVGVLAGALTALFGILVLIWPRVGVITLIWLVGIWALIWGVALIVLGLRLRKVSQELRRA